MAHSFVKLLFLECPGCGVPMQFADREDEYPACNMFLTFEGELRCKKCLEGGDAKPIDFLYEERYLYWAVKLDERRLESSRIAVPLAIRKQLEMVEGFYVGKEPREAVVVKTVKPVNGHGASAKGLYPEIPELGFTIVRNTE
ncbi:unnamed protein product, partial [Mesorhabditis spiculigera]